MILVQHSGMRLLPLGLLVTLLMLDCYRSTRSDSEAGYSASSSSSKELDYGECIAFILLIIAIEYSIKLIMIHLMYLVQIGKDLIEFVTYLHPCQIKSMHIQIQLIISTSIKDTQDGGLPV